MRKVIAAIKLAIDGFCVHTEGVPDEECIAVLWFGLDEILLGF